MPGSSGTMKETYIFTPITPKPPASNVGGAAAANGAGSVAVETASISPVNAIESPTLRSTCDENDPFQSDTIVIKENVVKKEYRDVEYEPSKLVANASIDDFTDFQFVQPVQSMPSSNSIIEQNLNIANISPLTVQSASMSFLSDIYDKPGKEKVDIISPSGTAAAIPSMTGGNRLEFEQLACATDPMEIYSIPSSAFEQPQSTISSAPLSMKSSTQHTNSSNDNNNTKSMATAQSTNNNNNSCITNNSINSARSTTYTGGTSTILMPQMANNVQSKHANAASNPLTIAWPEPGINIDQLEQLEARFSTQPDATNKCSKNETKNTAAKDAAPSSTADDEWSDFVSVVQPQTPITNILNKNLLKQQNNDEDDWSEFVSSKPPSSLNSLQQFAPPPHNFLAGINANPNANYNSVFTPWTTTPFQQKMNAYHQTPSDGYAKSASNSLRYTKTVNSMANGGESSHQYQNAMAKSKAAPSIISLPDLGFVAPKSLLNMPNRTLAKK